MIYDILQVQGDTVRYELELCGRLTIVGGDSGTGKSFLSTLVSNQKMNEKTMQNVSIFSYKSGITLAEFLTVMQGKRHLLIIDNYDAFASRKAAELIAGDEVNQYLIFARYARFLPVSKYNYRELLEQDGMITLAKGKTA